MADPTRILALSDLNWTSRGTTVESFIALVERTNPALVLLAGDIVDNDKGKGEAKCLSCWEEMSKALDALEARKLPCCIVRGNWDEKPVYDALMARPYEYIQEISNRIVDINGLKIWGIPHNRTINKTSMPSNQGQPVDILLTHADGTRRMMLFEYPAKLIVTGHYDEKVSVVRNRAFVSFSQFPNQYAVIDYAPDDIRISYRYNERFRIQAEDTFYEVHVRHGAATWTTERAQHQGEQYATQMEGLLDLKERESQLTADEKREAIRHLLTLRVPAAQIKEHIEKSGPILTKLKAERKPQP